MAIGRTAAELTAAIASERAAKLAEDEQWDRAIDRVSNTNLRRREGDSMDRFRTGDIDVRKLDANSMSAYRQGLTANDLARIQSGERVGTLQSNNIYNLGLDTNRTSAANVGRNATATENVAGFGAVASMFGAEKGAEAAARPYKQLTRAQQLAVDAFGPQALNPQGENLRMLQIANQNEQESVFQNALNEQARKNLEEYNGYNLWDSKRKDRMQELVDSGMSPEGAARKMSIDELTPLYGRSSGASVAQPQPPVTDGGSPTNRIQTLGAPGLLSQPSPQGRGPSYDDFLKWQNSRNR